MRLSGVRVAIMVEEQYQDLEVWYPHYRLREEGATTVMVGSGTAPEYRGKYGYPAKAETTVLVEKGETYDAVLVPGGFAPDFMRRVPRAVEFLREAAAAGRIIASICHGPWLLASAGVLKGRRATCFSAIKDDVANAGALYRDEECVVDGNLITARKPDDLPAFTARLIEALAKVPAGR